MRALVVGGSGSGKSSFAEKLACQLATRRFYLATMAPFGNEAHRRIERHRRQREGLGFTTIECPHGTLSPATHLAPQLKLPRPDATAPLSGSVALLDDVGNLVANALFSGEGDMRDPHDTVKHLEREILALSRMFEHVVVVGNEVGSEGPYRSEETHTWVRLVGTLCCRLAQHYDLVAEVTAGIPLIAKGELTW